MFVYYILQDSSLRFLTELYNHMQAVKYSSTVHDYSIVHECPQNGFQKEMSSQHSAATKRSLLSK